MAQHDYVIDNQSFPATRTDLNNVLQAIVSNNSGTSAPSTTFANQLFYNSSTNVLSIRNEDNDAFIPLMQFDQSADVAATLATVIDILDASGTNQAGTALTIRGGAGTGTGAGGSIILQTADGGSSGSSVNSHATRVTITDDGNVGIGATPNAYTGFTVLTLGGSGSSDLDFEKNGTLIASQFTTSSNDKFFIQSVQDGMVFQTAGSNDRMIIDSSGNVAIGTTSTSNKLEVRGVGLFSSDGNYRATNSGVLNVSPNGNLGIGFGGDSDASYFACIFHNASNTAVGSISVSASATTYSTSSDYRLKENVVELTGAIDRVKTLSPKRFNFKVDPDNTVDGFLAHEVTTVPEAVTGTKDETRSVSNAVLSADGKRLAKDILQSEWTAGKLPTTDQDGNKVDALYPSDSTWVASHTEPVYQGIDQAKLVPLLTAALQEAIAKIETLETKVDALEG